MSSSIDGMYRRAGARGRSGRGGDEALSNREELPGRPPVTAGGRI